MEKKIELVGFGEVVIKESDMEIIKFLKSVFDELEIKEKTKTHKKNFKTVMCVKPEISYMASEKKKKDFMGKIMLYFFNLTKDLIIRLEKNKNDVIVDQVISRKWLDKVVDDILNEKSVAENAIKYIPKYTEDVFLSKHFHTMVLISYLSRLTTIHKFENEKFEDTNGDIFTMKEGAMNIGFFCTKKHCTEKLKPYLISFFKIMIKTKLINENGFSTINCIRQIFYSALYSSLIGISEQNKEDKSKIKKEHILFAQNMEMVAYVIQQLIYVKLTNKEQKEIKF
jgi:hypothetical protein